MSNDLETEDSSSCSEPELEVEVITSAHANETLDGAATVDYSEEVLKPNADKGKFEVIFPEIIRVIGYHLCGSKVEAAGAGVQMICWKSVGIECSWRQEFTYGDPCCFRDVDMDALMLVKNH